MIDRVLFFKRCRVCSSAENKLPHTTCTSVILYRETAVGGRESRASGKGQAGKFPQSLKVQRAS